MAIMAIGGADSIKSNSGRINFKGPEVDEIDVREYNISKKSSGAKKVPVIVLMAMTPSLLSAATEQSTVPPAVEDAIEIYQPSRSNSEDKAIAPYPETEVFEQYGQQKLPELMGPEAVQYKRDFNYHGKRYTMYFFDLVKSVRKDKNVVSRIYFIPSDFNYIEKFDNPCNYPPVMKKLVYHDLGDLNKDFISVITTEQVCDKNGENSRYVEKEMRLPDDVANDLVHLFNGDTNLKVTQTLMNMVTETYSPKLLGKY